jgi:dTDP-3-amino-3,4,6-trideoxy-alpha-D-glucose transaminase
MRVPFLDLDAAYRELEHPIDAAAKRVLGSGRFILGAEVEQFEHRFADFVGARHCVGVGNGLDALTLALAALGVGPGDEVIVPAATALPTWLAVSRIGATIVPTGVDESTFTLEPVAFEAAITARTRAVIPVHLYGHPADIDTVARIAGDHGLVVVDDGAQAHGARCRGRPVGGLTPATAFSFYPTKNLGAVGDAGAVTTDDDVIADRVRMLRNYGESEKYRNECPGWNSRLDPLQAAILGVKLDKLDEWNSRRRRVAARYREALSELGWLRLPSEAPWATHVYHLFVIRVACRDDLIEHLAANSVATAVHYPTPPYSQPAYRDVSVPWPTADLDAMHREVLSLPLNPHLSDAQVDCVIEAIKQFRRRRRPGSHAAALATSSGDDHARSPRDG